MPRDEIERHNIFLKLRGMCFGFKLLLIIIYITIFNKPNLLFAKPRFELVPSHLISVGINYPAGLNLELGGVYGVEHKSGGYDNLGATGFGLSGLVGTHGVMLTSGFGITRRFGFPLLLGLIGPSYFKRYDHAEYFGGRLTLQVLFFGLDFGLFYRIDDDQLQNYLINFGVKFGP